jgi:hypothetical protein
MCLILFTDKPIPPALLIQQRVTRVKQCQLQAASAPVTDEDCFAVEFDHRQYYLAEQPTIRLLALICIQVSPSGSVSIEGSILPFSSVLREELQFLNPDSSNLRQYCKQNGFVWVQFTAPWLLVPVQVPKPWGRELWFTGIEARGQSEVQGEGGNLPLPWVLSLFPQTKESTEEIILLKVLDPLPDEVYGDLYLELHEQKQEVYVVTHIDSQAWPGEVASMQLGFNQEQRRRYSDDEAFKRSYLKAVQDYEKVRRRLDVVLEKKKSQAAIPSNQPVAVEVLKKWMNELSQHIETKNLVEQEKILRSSMDAFIGSHRLRVGDWVRVPRNMPHSLKHGIRVIEFQTPVYERKILSFAQQVLTQTHWDTASALQLAELGSYQQDEPVILECSDFGSVERIASFDDFEVRRIQLNSFMQLDGAQYSLLMVLEGEVHIETGDALMHLTSGQTVLMPEVEKFWRINPGRPAILLHSIPLPLSAK